MYTCAGRGPPGRAYISNYYYDVSAYVILAGALYDEVLDKECSAIVSVNIPSLSSRDFRVRWFRINDKHFQKKTRRVLPV